MDVNGFISMVTKIVWIFVAIAICVSVTYYRKILTNKQFVSVVSIKANSYVYWVEVDFPQLSYTEKISLIRKVIIDELLLLGFSPTKKTQCIDREIKAAFEKKKNTCKFFEETPVEDEDVETIDYNKL